MKYTKAQFLEEVKTEARNIRQNATKDELARLDFETFDPNNKQWCIYGQMAFACTSDRAAALIDKCCIRYFINDPDTFEEEEGFNGVKKAVNGERVAGFIKERSEQFSLRHLSAIETYINLPNAKNKNLIDFLQGKRDDLVL